ncbi:MAG: helix-turn-helix transcriptional regulator [Spirosomataceae bacterium]
MEIGEKIRLLRERKGYKQEFMADELQMTINGYGKIERGEVDVSWGKLEKISRVLGLSNASELVKLDERQFFVYHVNQITNQTSNGLVYNELSNQERTIYEKHIESLENHIKTLQDLIVTLKK